MMMNEAMSRYSASLRRLGRSERTIEWYEMHLKNFDRSRPLNDLELITLNQLRNHIDDLLARKLKPSTVRGAAMSLRIFFRWCVAEGLLKSDPAERLELIAVPERVPSALDISEILALLSAAAGSNHPERDQALISFFVETGARLSEVVGLKIDDVDLAGGVAVVRGKGNRQRFVFFDASTRKVLMMWLAVRTDRADRSLFGLAAAGIRQVLERLGRRSGVKVHPHLFRHTAATLRAENGAQEQDLQAFFGWRTPKMSQVYVVQARLHGRAKLSSPMNGVMREQLITDQMVVGSTPAEGT